MRGILKALGLPDFRRVHVQAIGDESPYGENARMYGDDNEGPRETAVWMALEHEDKSALDIFAREIAAAGTGKGLVYSKWTIFSDVPYKFGVVDLFAESFSTHH